MTVGDEDKQPITNATATDDSVVDELDRLSSDGGVAPLIPHRQANQANDRVSKET